MLGLISWLAPRKARGGQVKTGKQVCYMCSFHLMSASKCELWKKKKTIHRVVIQSFIKKQKQKPSMSDS